MTFWDHVLSQNEEKVTSLHHLTRVTRVTCGINYRGRQDLS